MNIKLLKIGWRFVLLILIVTVIQFSLLKIILQFGFTSDDWWLLFEYKIYGRAESFLDRYLIALHANGLYHTYQIMYIGILESLFKGNYQAYQITNIMFKALATLSLYPLIVIVFKRRLLAFLTTILYGISYSSSGALLFVTTGSDYLAIFFMNIFLLSYYCYFVTRRKFLLSIATMLLFLSFIFSPIRMYPLLGFVVLIEIFVWIKSRKLLSFVDSLKRLVLLFFPFFIILRIAPGATGGHLNGLSTVYNFLSLGNYQLLLSPFAGLGYTFLTNDYWPLIFGNVIFDNFKDYLFFLLNRPLIIYSILTILLGFLITKKPLLFILGIIFVNFIFEIMCYFLIANLRGAVGPHVKGFHEASIYAIFLGFFLLSIAIASLLIWLKTYRSNILLLSLFVGPLFSSVFLWGTWMIKGDAVTFKEGIHWYLVTVVIGSSLFLAGIMALVFDRIRLITIPYLKYVLMTCLFLIILPIYLVSSKEINTTFLYLLSVGYGASDQEDMKDKFLISIKDPLDQKPRLFYFETEGQKYYPISLLDGFEERMHFQNWEVMDGCVGLIYDRNILKKSITIKDGVKGFNVHSLCVENSFAAGRKEVFYSPDNFYAFKLQDREAINIKEKLLKDLNF